MRYLLSIFSLCIVTVDLFAADRNSFIICNRNRDVRWIRIYSADDGKCRTIYSKEGFTQIVSSATYYSSCESVLNNVKKNVEAGGFKCQEAVLGHVIEIN